MVPLGGRTGDDGGSAAPTLSPCRGTSAITDSCRGGHGWPEVTVLTFPSRVRDVGVLGAWVLAVACGDPDPASNEDASSETGGDASGTSAATAATSAPSTSGPDPSAEESADGASSDEGGSESTGGGPPLPPDPCIAAGTCPPGEWIDVTPTDLGDVEFGPGPVVRDPGKPTDLYMAGGGDGLWKSEDYGNTWSRINDTIGYVPMGLIMAVAPTEPATLWVAGYQHLLRSVDGGASFEMFPFDFPAELYSIQVDPYDSDHLVSGLHEADGIVESVDAGETWTDVAGPTLPAGGVSWYAFFIDEGDPKVTRQTWFAIAQNGASAVITRDGGDTWTVPQGLQGLNHPHGNTQIFQRDQTIFVAGVGGPGDGVYRSIDGGEAFERVLEGSRAIVWGTDDAVYSMWGWACADCDLGASFSTAPLPGGDTWSMPDVPEALIIGANHIAVTSDGEHDIFVGTMWSSGVWRYVEP